jgi:hypothetical protein
MSIKMESRRLLSSPSELTMLGYSNNKNYFVHRAKALFSSGCKSRPATFAPAGGNWSSRGGNQAACITVEVK